MNKLKKIGMIVGMTIGTTVLIAQQTNEGHTPFSSNSFIILTGVNFKTSFNPLGRFNPFVDVGVYAKPIRFHSYYPSRDLHYVTPATVSSLEGGIDLRVADAIAVVAKVRYDNPIWPSIQSYQEYQRLKLSLGLSYKRSLSPTSGIVIYAGIFEDIEYISHRGFYSFHRNGPELGFEYERFLSPKLSLNTRIGYSHNFAWGSYDVPEGPKGKRVASVGFHYRLHPVIPDGNFQQRARTPKHRTPRTQQRPTHRQLQVPCPAHKSNYRPTSDIFKRP